MQNFSERKKEWPILALAFLLVTLSISAGLSSVQLFESSVQKQVLRAVLGYGFGVSLFARFFRLCMQRMAVCALFYLGSKTLFGLLLTALGSFVLCCSYGYAWGCIFNGLPGLKILIGVIVFLAQVLIQILAFFTLMAAMIKQMHRQFLERDIPKSSMEAARDSIPYLKKCLRSFACWAVCALAEAVLLEGVFEMLEYTLF